jgi:hypothetical protein
LSAEDIRKNLKDKGLATFNGEYFNLSQKAYDLIETEKKLPKGMKYRCFVCHAIVDKICNRCENYFCKEHRVPNWEYNNGHILCFPCDKFIQEHFG